MKKRKKNEKMNTKKNKTKKKGLDFLKEETKKRFVLWFVMFLFLLMLHDRNVGNDELAKFVYCWNCIGSFDGYATMMIFFRKICDNPDKLIGYVDYLINELEFVDKINNVLINQLRKDKFDHILMSKLLHFLHILIDSYQSDNQCNQSNIDYKIDHDCNTCGCYYYNCLPHNQHKRVIQTLLKYVARDDVFVCCRVLASTQLCLLSLASTVITKNGC